MAMATSPSRLDPPRVAILPTSVLGNNNTVLIAKVFREHGKKKHVRRIGNPKCQANQAANIPVTTARLRSW